jgi:hypothetical protein
MLQYEMVTTKKLESLKIKTNRIGIIEVHANFYQHIL